MSSIQQYKEYNKRLKKDLNINQRLREGLERKVNRLEHEVGRLNILNEVYRGTINYYEKKYWIKRTFKNIIRFVTSIKKK